MKSYEEMTREADALRDAGKELDDLMPVRAHVGREVRAVFSLRLSPTELTQVTAAANERGQSVSDFVRLAALAVARHEVDIDSASQAAALDEVRARALDLVQAVDRASGIAGRRLPRRTTARSTAKRHAPAK